MIELTYDQFVVICKREFENGFGNVEEIHLDVNGYNELLPTVKGSSQFETISSLVNPITGTVATLTVHKNHLVVKRPPLPPATTHTVML